MEVINELFGYRKLKIIQRTDMFNFSLDSIILSFFCTVNKKVRSVIDLCSGNAPIPMYLTLRTSNPIDAVEIQDVSYDLGLRSIKLNNLENQITLYHDDLVGFHKKTKKRYDLVTVNPPFFKVHDEERFNDSEYKTIARHEVKVNLEQIIVESKRLLNYGGYFAMVHRPDRLSEIMELMIKHKIEPRRIRFVYPRIDSEANTVLIEGKMSNKSQGLIVEKPLIVYKNATEYSDEVMSLFNYKAE